MPCNLTSFAALATSFSRLVTLRKRNLQHCFLFPFSIRLLHPHPRTCTHAHETENTHFFLLLSFALFLLGNHELTVAFSAVFVISIVECQAALDTAPRTLTCIVVANTSFVLLTIVVRLHFCFAFCSFFFCKQADAVW